MFLEFIGVPLNFESWVSDANMSIISFRKNDKIQNIKITISSQLINIFE